MGVQDVIRLATRKKSAIDVWQDIEAGGWSMPHDFRHVLFTAEDQAQRALLWCRPSSADEHNALQQLHDTYVQVVHDLTTLHPARALLINEVVKILAANPHPLVHVHSCNHFARCYGLNHFLVLLLARVVTIGNLVSGPHLRPKHGVAAVAGHGCAAIRGHATVRITRFICNTDLYALAPQGADGRPGERAMFSLFGTASRRIQHSLVRRWPSPDKSCHITSPELGSKGNSLNSFDIMASL